MSNEIEKSNEVEIESKSRRKFFGKSALIGAGAVAAPMTAAMFASQAQANAKKAANSATVHPGELDEYYGFWSGGHLSSLK